MGSGFVVADGAGVAYILTASHVLIKINVIAELQAAIQCQPHR